MSRALTTRATTAGATVRTTVTVAVPATLTLPRALTTRATTAGATVRTTVTVAVPATRPLSRALTTGATTAGTTVGTTIAITLPAALAWATGATRTSALPLPLTLATALALPLALTLTPTITLTTGAGRAARTTALALPLRRTSALGAWTTRTRSFRPSLRAPGGRWRLGPRRRGRGRNARLLTAVLAARATAALVLGIGGRAGQKRQHERG